MVEEDMLRRPQMNWEKGRKKKMRKMHVRLVASFATVNEKGRSSAELVFARGPRSNYLLLELVYILIGSVNSVSAIQVCMT
jgi:hypothetical protein